MKKLLWLVLTGLSFTATAQETPTEPPPSVTGTTSTSAAPTRVPPMDINAPGWSILVRPDPILGVCATVNAAAYDSADGTMESLSAKTFCWKGNLTPEVLKLGVEAMLHEWRIRNGFPDPAPVVVPETTETPSN